MVGPAEDWPSTVMVHCRLEPAPFGSVQAITLCGRLELLVKALELVLLSAAPPVSACRKV